MYLPSHLCMRYPDMDLLTDINDQSTCIEIDDDASKQVVEILKFDENDNNPGVGIIPSW